VETCREHIISYLCALLHSGLDRPNSILADVSKLFLSRPHLFSAASRDVEIRNGFLKQVTKALKQKLSLTSDDGQVDFYTVKNSVQAIPRCVLSCILLFVSRACRDSADETKPAKEVKDVKIRIIRRATPQPEAPPTAHLLLLDAILLNENHSSIALLVQENPRLCEELLHSQNERLNILAVECMSPKSCIEALESFALSENLTLCIFTSLDIALSSSTSDIASFLHEVRNGDRGGARLQHIIRSYPRGGVEGPFAKLVRSLVADQDKMPAITSPPTASALIPALQQADGESLDVIFAQAINGSQSEVIRACSLLSQRLQTMMRLEPHLIEGWLKEVSF
jgi:hypothetical protein